MNASEISFDYNNGWHFILSYLRCLFSVNTWYVWWRKYCLYNITKWQYCKQSRHSKKAKNNLYLQQKFKLN